MSRKESRSFRLRRILSSEVWWRAGGIFADIWRKGESYEWQQGLIIPTDEKHVQNLLGWISEKEIVREEFTEDMELRLLKLETRPVWELWYLRKVKSHYRRPSKKVVKIIFLKMIVEVIFYWCITIDY